MATSDLPAAPVVYATRMDTNAPANDLTCDGADVLGGLERNRRANVSWLTEFPMKSFARWWLPVGIAHVLTSGMAIAPFGPATIVVLHSVAVAATLHRG